MRITRFDPDDDLIFVDGRVWSRRLDRWRALRLVLDTGAAETIIVPEVLDELGYTSDDAERMTVMRSAVGHERGYLLRVARFSCLGHRADDYSVHAQSLPDGWGIEGLIGLTFLRQLNYEVRSAEGRIIATRIWAGRNVATTSSEATIPDPTNGAYVARSPLSGEAQPDRPWQDPLRGVHRSGRGARVARRCLRSPGAFASRRSQLAQGKHGDRDRT